MQLNIIGNILDVETDYIMTNIVAKNKMYGAFYLLNSLIVHRFQT